MVLKKGDLGFLIYPKVTIGICTRNDERTLGMLFESILSLDYPKDMLEIIVVDGESNDRTLEIVGFYFDRLGAKSLQLSDRGFGLGYARNLIVENSLADFIAFIDADQYLDPLWLRESIVELLNYPSVGSVRGVVGLTPCDSMAAKLEAYDAFVKNADVSKDLDVWSFAIGGSLVRKTAIIDSGRFNPKIAFVGEDTDLGFRMVNRGWKLKNSHKAVFYHQPRFTWKDLYKQKCGFANAAYNIGKRYYPYKSKKRLFVDTIKSCVGEIKFFFRAFRVTHDLNCILLPVKNVFTEVSYFLTFALR